MAFVSYAQNYEDVLLWRALGDVERGFYIDVGASHPDVDSVTRAFFERGWRGINVEPVAEDAARIAAARPGDITLQLALGCRDGEAEFFTVPGTGLSTLDPNVAHTYQGAQWDMHATQVATRTLDSVCRTYVRGPIHFLKIDVEGAEGDVLAGADLEAWRPWIILIEATAPRSTVPAHAQWEPVLLRHGYRFVWFDGLNRFYVAGEQAGRLSRHFQVPPNVFDDFIKATDIELAGRLVVAEQRSVEAERALAAGLQAMASQADLAIEQADFAKHTLIEVRQTLTTSLIECQTDLHFARHELQQTHIRLQAALRESQETRVWLDAVKASTSWRLTGPLRVALRRLEHSFGKRRRVAPPAPPPPIPRNEAQVAQPPAAEPSLPAGFFDVPAMPPAASFAPGPRRLRRAVHQFHSGSAVADAITNAMLLTRSVLRQLGYESEIYVTHRARELAQELRLIDELPDHDGYVLIVRHSMGHDAFDRIVALPAPKLLIYHNITPPDLLARHPVLASYAELGRRQLAVLPTQIHTALADSEFNAIELRELGFDPVHACTLLFDSDAMRADAGRHAGRAKAPFTVLFVGRICQSKGQLELLAAWREFRALYGRAARLVLVGRSDGAEDAYAQAVETAAASGPYADEIVLTGLITDAERDAWYACASLYVSLSRHEGFGVPLVEAMAHRIPVLARAAGAVPYTLGNPACLLPSEADAAQIGKIMYAHASDPELLAELGASLCDSLDRFSLPGQTAILQRALLRAGAVPPDEPATRAALDAHLHFAVTGHVNKTYSLAAVNRGLVLTLEAARPGMSRLIPVEGVITSDLSGVPVSEAAAIAALVQRAAPLSAPELVISQHYPVHVPQSAAGHASGQIRLALLFWEESLLPAATIATLEQGFDGVVAPTRFVASALLNSGLRLPVRVIDHAPRLHAFLQVERGGAAAAAENGLTFLHVSSCFPRKGVDLLLDAWAASFTAADPVRLIIKSFANPHNQVAAEIESLRARHPDLAPITLIERDLDEREMADLYAGSDVMVLPSRGEGYNLPAAEALAAGMRLIVTGAGGHMDFCAGHGGGTSPRVRLLRWRFARSESHLATPHSLWVQPDRDDLADALREAAAETCVEPSGAEAVGRHASPPAAATADALARFGIDLLLRPVRPKMRIGWISTWNQRCGVAGYSRLLLDALGNDPGADITVLCDRRTPPHTVDAASIPHLPCWSLGMEAIEPLLQALARLDPDVVVVQHQPGLAEWPNLVRLIDLVLAQGRVITVTLHNTRDLLELPAALAGTVLAALSRVDRVIVHTLAAMNQLVEQGLAERLVLFPQGIRKPRPSRPPRMLCAQDAPIIGSTGFFLRGKGIDRLIEAALKLQRDWPNLQLRLVNAAYGSDGSEAEIERARAAAAPLGDRVQFVTEFLAEGELLDRLEDCDIIVLPYRPSKEASSAALRTALTTSVPVAVSRIALFDEADDAVLRIDATDPVPLAAGIDDLLRDLALRRQVQDAAQDWMHARGWAPIARRLIGMLDGLVQTRI